MPIREKKLMGGDEMGRIGAVRTMQDEIDMGLRDKDGRLLSTEEKVEETVAQEPEQATPVEDQGSGQEADSPEPTGPNVESKPEAVADPEAPEPPADPEPVQ